MCLRIDRLAVDSLGLSWVLGCISSPISWITEEGSKEAPVFLPRSLLLDGCYLLPECAVSHRAFKR